MNIASHSQSPAWWPWWEEWMWNGTEPSPQPALSPKVMPCDLVMPAACPEARPVGILTSFAPWEVAVWVLRLLCSWWAWNCTTVSSLVFRLSSCHPSPVALRGSVSSSLKGLTGTKMSMALPVPLALAATSQIGGWPTLESGSKIHYSEKVPLCVNLVKSRTATEHKLQKFQLAPFYWY